jgi:hypothetical protein
MPGDQITILKTTSERPPRLLAPSLKQFTELFLYAWPWAKPLALQARLSRPPMPLFFVVLLRQFGLRPRVYDSNLTSHQVGSVYFIFRLLALHEKSSQESFRIKG